MQDVFGAQEVSRSFGVVQALSAVTLGIGAGEVHAVIGENGAGKSTLMNIFCGKLLPSAGTLVRDGAPVAFHSPLDAHRAGIAIAPQEVNLVPALSVAENVLLGAQAGGAAGIDWRATRKRAVEALEKIDPSIDPDAAVSRLSKAQQQMVQIARAVATDARILIFDEPTAALTDREAGKLFAFIESFRARGGSVFYISHRLDEILLVADRISVLRDGKLVGELDPQSTDKDAMVRLMAGRAVSAERGAARPAPSGEVVLAVRGLTRPGEFRDVGFELRRGEILGIAGLVGSGRTELGKCLFGVTRASAGDVEVFGEPVKIRHPADAIARGFVYLPEERKHDGIFPLLSITENTAIATLDRFRGLLGLNFGEMVREVEDYVRRLRIKIGRPSDPITSLSGGNQQKVILARWLLRDSRILILDEPTRGIDVNAKFEIQALLRRLSDEGLSLIYISSELQEVLDVSDRILVMHEGRVKGIRNAGGETQESLLRLAMS
jgi:ribose transport system ATP-binding protein